MRKFIDVNSLLVKLYSRKDLLISAWSLNLEISPEDKARLDELCICINEVLNVPIVEVVPYDQISNC